jgi:hypothetical protein
LTTVMSKRSMKVATETAIRVHHLRSIEIGSPRHIGCVWGVTPMTERNVRM